MHRERDREKEFEAKRRSTNTVVARRIEQLAGAAIQREREKERADSAGERHSPGRRGEENSSAVVTAERDMR